MQLGGQRGGHTTCACRLLCSLVRQGRRVRLRTEGASVLRRPAVCKAAPSFTTPCVFLPHMHSVLKTHRSSSTIQQSALTAIGTLVPETDANLISRDVRLFVLFFNGNRPTTVTSRFPWSVPIKTIFDFVRAIGGIFSSRCNFC